MSLSDMVVKAKVNRALAGHSRLNTQEIDAQVEDGIVTLTGNADTQEIAQQAADRARTAPGVREVRNEIQWDSARAVTTPEEIVERFLQKLETQWAQLPNAYAITQADYLRWALWMITKFHIPEPLQVAEADRWKQEATERALEQIAGHVALPKVALALELLTQAEAIADSERIDAPPTFTPSLSTSPVASESEQDRSEHIARAGVH